MDYKVNVFKKISDKRGDLVVFLGNKNLPESAKQFGQIYFVTFSKKGVVRGNHYHKKWREWFGLIKGKIEVALRDVNTGELKKIVLDAESDEYIRLEVGPYVTHAFKCLSKNAQLLNYANGEWEASDCYNDLILQ